MTKEHLYEMHRENVLLLLLLLLLLLFSGGRFLWWVALQMCFPHLPHPSDSLLSGGPCEGERNLNFLRLHMLGVLGTTLLCRSFLAPLSSRCQPVWGFLAKLNGLS